MRVIFVMADSFRRDHIGVYGNDWIHTPNLDRLALTSHVFDQHYIGSFPTLPNRRDLHLGTGGKGNPFNPWAPLTAEDVTLAERLFDAGISTMMVNDTANSCLQTRTVSNAIVQMNMNKGFEFFLGNRGQEGDNCFSDAEVPLEFPVPGDLIRYPACGWHKVLMSQAHRVHEEDWFAPGTFQMACKWLERNRRRKDFFLWVETFDPHEPWDPPAWYVDRYDPGYDGRVFQAPAYGLWKKMGLTEAEMKHVRALYAGECTMVDAAMGRLLATLDRLNMLEDTAIVFTSDHGTYMSYAGDNGLLGKPHKIGADGMLHSAGRAPKPPVLPLPQYTGVCRIPLIVRLPRQTKSRRWEQITQPWDLAPTILDLFGQSIPAEFIGQSLLPVMAGKRKLARKAAVMGQTGAHIQAANADWIFTLWPRSERAGEAKPPCLVDLRNDPLQERNVAREHPEVCQAMYCAIEAFVERQPNVPESYLAGFENGGE